MAIKWRIKCEGFMDKVEIGRVERAASILKAKDLTALDSYSMSPNGPILSSIFLIGEGYLAEVKMGGKHFSFDFCPVNLIDNYRIDFGEHEFQAEASEVPIAPTVGQIELHETKKITTQFVTLKLTHTPALATTATFFGEDVDAWLQFVLENLPASTITSRN